MKYVEVHILIVILFSTDDLETKSKSMNIEGTYFSVIISQNQIQIPININEL